MLPVSLGASAMFLVATAEKIPAHDYSLFMPSVPLFLSAGLVLSSLFEKLSLPKFLPLFVLLLLSMAVPSYRNLEKALGENPDVLSCAAALQERIGAEELVAVYTDLSRYNALSYSAGRFSVRAEGTVFPVGAYKKVGATYLVVNLPQEEFAGYEGWLLKNSVQNRLFLAESLDFKARQRVCALYPLTERP